MQYSLRPSQSPMWVVCHGYRKMAAQFPELVGSVDNTVREEGLATHWGSHQISKGDVLFVGEKAPNGVVLTQELYDGALGFVREVETWGVPAQHELTLPARYIHEECGGTSDAFGYNDKLPRPLIHLADLKMGYRSVDPFENLQLAIYASSICDYLGINGHLEQFVDIEFTIFQPRDFGGMSGPVKKWRTALTNLRPIWNRLIAAARATMEPDAPLKSGNHCADCSARYACPALQRAGATVLDITAHSEPHLLDAPALGTALALVDEAYELVKSLRDGLVMQAEHMQRGGALIPGYMNKPTIGRLAWNENVDDEVITIAKMLNIEVVKPRELITPTQAKNAKFPEEFLKEYATRKQSGMKLTRVRENTIRKMFEGS